MKFPSKMCNSRDHLKGDWPVLFGGVCCWRATCCGGGPAGISGIWGWVPYWRRGCLIVREGALLSKGVPYCQGGCLIVMRGCLTGNLGRKSCPTLNWPDNRRNGSCLCFLSVKFHFVTPMGKIVFLRAPLKETL